MKLPPEIPEADEPDAKVEDAPGGETVSKETRDGEDEDGDRAKCWRMCARRPGTISTITNARRCCAGSRGACRSTRSKSFRSISNSSARIRWRRRALLQDLLIGVTHFFRDRDAFAALEAHIPQLFAGKRAEDEVRVWVAGCATGEEAYSIAMLLCEHCKRLENPPKVQIFATDIDEAGNRGCARRALSVNDRGGRLAGAVARIFRRRTTAVTECGRRSARRCFSPRTIC